jgi:vacuolar-type H+-ATPase subunit H
MRDMMREATNSGVRLLAYADIRKFHSKIFKLRFEVKPEVEAAYKEYMSIIGAPTTVEQAMIVHMEALYSAWGTMTRRKIKTPDLIEAEGKTGIKKEIGHPGIAREAELLLSRDKAKAYALAHSKPKISADILQVTGMKYSLIVRPEKWRLDAWQKTAPDPVLNFIKSCVHDSKAGFMHSVEPFSYFRPRGMAESSRNVLARGLDWLDETVTAIKNGIIKVYHRAEGVVVETWEEGKLIATRTYRVGEKFVVDTAKAGAKYTVEVYQSGKQVLISTMKKGEQMIITSIDTAKKEASELADAAQKKTGELVDAAQKKATEVGHQIQDGASQLVKNAGQAVDTGMKAVEDGWHATQAAFGF